MALRVFRVNGAVIRGFERDVGTRTSFYGFTVNTLKHSLVQYRRDGFTRVPRGPVNHPPVGRVPLGGCAPGGPPSVSPYAVFVVPLCLRTRGTSSSPPTSGTT